MIGILGKGQLGDMLEEAAQKIGVPCCFYKPDDSTPEALEQLMQQCVVITFENENVPLTVAMPIAAANLLKPSLKALQISSHRLLEKNCFQSLGIPTADFRAVDSEATLEAAIIDLGFPLILKTTTLGYDGKGQQWFRNREDVLLNPLDFTKSWIAEKVIDFVEEVSLVAARRANGDTVYYPLAQNKHHAGILRQSRVVPDSPYAALESVARTAMDVLMAYFDYVGVLTIEFFVTKSGELLANECAPRVHNSGHWSIEGTQASQFENHMRAILDAPLGSTAMLHGAVGMINVIGTFPDRAQAPQGPYHWHDYHKAPRPNRKLGHVTITAPDLQTLNDEMQRLQGWMDSVSTK